MAPELSAEQKKRIEENKQRALRIRAEKRKASQDLERRAALQAQLPTKIRKKLEHDPFAAGGFVDCEEAGPHLSSSATPTTTDNAQRGEGVAAEALSAIHTPCESCGKRFASDAAYDLKYLQAFKLTVCLSCKASNEDYSLLSKAEVQKRYLLPEGSIRMMKYVEKDNPHHAAWTSMKLYLQRHAREKALKRWGSEGALEKERARREDKRLSATYAKTRKVLSSAS